MDKVVLGFAPTRRAIFSAPAAVVYRGLTAKRLKELNVDFVDIDDVNDEGLLYDDAGMEKIYEKFRDAKVDGLFELCKFFISFLFIFFVFHFSISDSQTHKKIRFLLLCTGTGYKLYIEKLKHSF